MSYTRFPSKSMLNGNSRSIRFALIRRLPRSELKNLYKLVSLNKFRSSSVKVPFATSASSSFVKEACVYVTRGSHCIASCIKVPHWAPVNTSSSDCNACGFRPNTEFARSSAETSTVAIGSFKVSIVPASSSRSWNRRFNSLTEIFAVRRVASLYG